MQVVDDKITVSDKDATPLSAFIRGQSVVGTVAISALGASGMPDWSNPSHHYGDSPFEVIQVYKLRRLLSCLKTTYKLSIKHLQVCQVLYVWIT